MGSAIPDLADFRTWLDQAAGARLAADVRVAVAVSGGADSMALCLLAAAALGTQRTVALSVDHRLRPQAAAEVRQVAATLKPFGIEHHILVWDHQGVAGNVQAEARQARYRLLEDWCVDHGVAWLLTAHHRRDQAETLLLNLARGSGVDGLAAMAAKRAPLTRPDGPALLRPLLAVSPATLRAYLTQHGVAWIEDPSNRNLDFDRVKARAMLARPALPGLNERRLAETARRMARVRAALEAITDRLLATAATWAPTGDAVVEWQPIVAAPEEIALRALARLLRQAGGTQTPLRLRAVEGLYRAIRDGGRLARTLAGVEVTPAGEGRVRLTREPRAATAAVDAVPGWTGVWDGRFHVALSEAVPQGLTIRAVGGEGWRQARIGVGGDVPRIVGLSQPGLWRDTTLVAAPTLGFTPEMAMDGVKITALCACLTPPTPYVDKVGRS